MDKAKLFEDRTPRETLQIPGVGAVTLRGVSRYELLMIGKKTDGDVLAFERMLLALAMVDPELSEDEVGRWQKAAPAGEMSILVKVANELSGIDKEVKEAQKAAYKSLRGEPGA